jgi:hypothetical protein
LTLTVVQTATAVAANCPASFNGAGGTSPYVFAVLPGGAGGTINASTGAYVGPVMASSNPAQAYDTIQVTDAAANTAQGKILVGTPLILFCDIISTYMQIPNGHVYLWDQKIPQPVDSNIYIAISVPVCKPFANINESVSIPMGGLASVQSVNMMATLDLNVISRGPAARDRKEEVILALDSTYSRQQQEANSFYVGKLPPSGGFINLSDQDGAAIPYRYKISVQVQYVYTKIVSAPYFDTFTEQVSFVNP